MQTLVLIKLLNENYRFLFIVFNLSITFQFHKQNKSFPKMNKNKLNNFPDSSTLREAEFSLHFLLFLNCLAALVSLFPGL